MKYFVTTKPTAIALSAMLFELSRPNLIQEPGDRTRRLLPILDHPSGQAAIEVPEEPFAVPLHPERNPARLMEVFGPFISPEEMELFRSIAGRAVVLDLSEIIPRAVRENLKTAEELGPDWFPALDPSQP